MADGWMKSGWRYQALNVFLFLACLALMFAVNPFQAQAQGEWDDCIDGTPHGECSSIKPLYCDMGILINRCDLCGCLGGQACTESGECSPGNLPKTEGYLSVATMSRQYEVGDVVELTDPPEEDQDSDIVTDFDNTDFNVQFMSDSTVPTGVLQKRVDGEKSLIYNVNTESQACPESQGYIIELRETPLLEKKSELDNEIESGKQKSEKLAEEYENIKIEGWNVVNPLAWGSKVYKGWELYNTDVHVANMEDNLPIELERQSRRLHEEHERFRMMIEDAGKSEGITGSVIVKAGAEAPPKEFTKTFNGVVLDIPEQDALDLKRLEEVEEVYPNLKVNTTLMDSIPLLDIDKIWELDSNSDKCAETGRDCLTGKDVTVAIIDTGIDYTHPDLGGCLGEGCKVIGGYDFVNSDDDPIDDNGHGTHCAGIVAGNGSLMGMAPDAGLIAYKVLNQDGSGYFSDVIAAIERSVDPDSDGDFSDHVDVASMSLGGSCFSYSEDCGPDDPVSKAVDRAVGSGVVFVIAAGNSGPREGTIVTPGTARKAITVGATYKINYDGTYWGDTDPRTNQIAPFSSRGPVEWDEGMVIKPDVVAPGAIICSARYDEIFPEGQNDYYKPCYDDEHVQLAGTSMATPHVAGMIALLRQRYPDWSPVQIKAAVKKHAKGLDYGIYTQGSGLIEAMSMINLSHAPPIAIIGTEGKVAGTTVDIIGSARGYDFENYSLYYMDEDSFENQNDEWLKLADSSAQVDDDVLYIWDISSLEERVYVLRLVVRTGDGIESEAYSPVRVVNTEIIYPKSLFEYDGIFDDFKVVFNADERLEINGTAAGHDFDHYSIEWCTISGCSDRGISLREGGARSVIDGKLAYWDIPSDIEPGYYHIILKNVYDNREHTVTIKIYVETELQSGWPRGIGVLGSGGFAYSFMRQPSIADINEDGKDDMIISYGEYLLAYNHDGSFIEGFPVKISTGRSMQQGSAIADVDEDGKPEIVVGDNYGHLHMFENDGKYKDGWPKRFGGYINVVTIEDLDGDGGYEMIFGDWSGRLHITDSNGDYLSGWPVRLESAPGYNHFKMVKDPITVADLDGDGNKEIIAGLFACNKSGSCSMPDSTVSISVMDIHGNSLPGWPKALSPYLSSDMFSIDIDDNGFLDILFSQGSEIHALDLEGRPLQGWPIGLSDVELTSVIAGDLDHDDVLDIVVSGESDWNSPQGYSDCLYVFDDELDLKEGFPVCHHDHIGNKQVTIGFSGVQFQLGNMHGSLNQIAGAGQSASRSLGTLYSFFIFNPDGTMPENFPKAMDNIVLGDSTPVADLDNDGDNELMVYTWGGKLFVWDLQGSPGDHEWPLFHHDAQHTGRYTQTSAAVCGNDVREDSEQCDGSDDVECPGECRDNCTCPPLPKSMINNTGEVNITGYLLLKVQKPEGSSWVDEEIIVDDFASGQPRAVRAGTHLALDTIWRDAGAYVTQGVGTFRAYAELQDSDGNAIITWDGNELSGAWEFSVV